jgi:hypothetical protein
MVRALLDGRKTQTRRIVKAPAKWAERFPICKPSGMVAGHEIWWWDGEFNRVGASQTCPYGVPGDSLWVKETWHPRAARSDWDLDIRYAADGEIRTIKDGEFGERDWTMPKAAATGNVSPLFMPRWASRLTLTITEVRVERLQDITEADAIAEGLYRSLPDDTDRDWFIAYTEEQNGSPPTPAEWDAFNAGVWMVPGVPQGWGRTPAERRRDTWGPSPQFCYRLLWDHIHGRGSWAANPWVWVLTFDVQVRR